jgi:parvulin-like peptidyl-prolyl isomerase
MQKLFQLVAALLLGACCAGAMVADRYAAQVSSRVITVGDVLGAMGGMRQRLVENFSGAELEKKMEEAYQKTLDMLVERALILEEFARSEQKLPEQVVDGRVNEIIHERFNNNRAHFFEALTEERLTIEDWRKEARDHFIVSMLRRREVGEKVVVTPGAVQALYQQRQAKYLLPEKIRLRAIVLRPGGTPALEQRAGALKQRLAAGEKFDVLAKQFSQGSGANSGGDWGWQQPSELRKELRAAVEKLQVGQISEPIRLDDDVYLLKLEERQAASQTPLAKVYAELEGDLREQEAERLYKDWIKRLRQKFFVKVFPLK